MIFTFAGYELDTDRVELRHGEEAIPLEPQVFGVLAHLVAHGDRAVTKEELLDEVWGDRFVSESALTSRIKAARRAVGDDGGSQRLIKTLYGRGYRFVGEVTVGGGGGGTSSQTTGLLDRDDALRMLGEAVEEAGRGTGRVVLVVGEPGIGKTSVARALVASVRDRATILWGGCDDLVTPRPLGPLHDIADVVPGLAAALAEPVSPSAVQQSLLGALARSSSTTVMVVEDVHWADEATLDVLTFLGRRIVGTRAVLLLTYRDTELGEDHPLLRLLGALPAEVVRTIELPPLSLDSVASIAGEDRAGRIMAVSNGNPFFVTELMAGVDADLPPSVRHAVVARVARLPETTREVLGVLAIEPTRLELELLDDVRPGWAAAMPPAERGGMVVIDEGHARFRHELARRAVLDSLPVARRRELHTQLLGALVARDAHPARIVHHAESAGDRALLATHAVRAARQASAASSHREAYSQVRRALDLLEVLPAEERAPVLQLASEEAYMTARADEAVEHATDALHAFEVAGDVVAVGRLHRWLSRVHWFTGRRAEAEAHATQAIAVLEPLGPSSELAWAYSNRSQLDMLAYNDDEALDWGRRAVELSRQVGDDVVTAHALINMGLVEVGRDLSHDTLVLDGVELALQVGEHHEATRGLVGLAFSFMLMNQLDRAAEMARRALEEGTRHEVESLAQYAAATLGRVEVLAGRWGHAEPELRGVVADGPPVSRLLALTALALLQARRGDADAADTLASAWELALEADEPQRIAPLAAAQAEWSWLSGELGSEVPRVRRTLEQLEVLQPVIAGELARWLHIAGEAVDVPPEVDEPYRLEVDGRWVEAADVWRDRGMPYDQALCLAWSQEPHRLESALAIAEELGARPLAAWIRSHMEDGGPLDMSSSSDAL